MSNIYIQEPPTQGKVLLKTMVGDIELELWSKEAPRACRNFVQLCMEGYYDNTIFHRVIKGFIVQGGDPTGTGMGGDSIYGKPFKDEFHTRLRFARRGLVAMANAGVHDNTSQFFFTLSPAPDLNGKHTIFAKVVGDTIYNMVKLEDVETDEDDRPLYPLRIIKTEILSSPFNDIVPRKIAKVEAVETDESSDNQSKGTKNFALLSFGSDAEDEEEETLKLNKDIKVRGKSCHDISNDPLLSSQVATDEQTVEDGEVTEEPETTEPSSVANGESQTAQDEPTKLSKSELLHIEAKNLKKEIQQGKKDAEKPVVAEIEAPEDLSGENDLIRQYKADRLRYKTAKKSIKKSGEREEKTLAILKQFQSKLGTLTALTAGIDEKEPEINEDEEFDSSWLNHKLNFATGEPSKVIDANIYDTERYQLTDPRNPINKRKREAPSDNSKQSGKSRR